MEVDFAEASKLRLISSESAKMIWEPSGAQWPSFCRVLSFFLETSGSIWTLERFFKFQLIYSWSDFNVTTNTGLRSAKSMLVIDLFRRAPFRDFRSWFWLAKRDLKWKKKSKILLNKKSRQRTCGQIMEYGIHTLTMNHGFPVQNRLHKTV